MTAVKTPTDDEEQNPVSNNNNKANQFSDKNSAHVTKVSLANFITKALPGRGEEGAAPRCFIHSANLQLERSCCWL